MADAGADFLKGIAPIIDQIKTNYPQLVPYLADPQLLSLFAEGMSKQMTSAQFQGFILASDWHRNTPPSARQWLSTQLLEPARAAQLKAQTSTQVQQIGTTVGVPLTTQQVDFLSQAALQEGWNATEIQRRIISQSAQAKLQPGQILATQGQLQQTASSYGIPISTNTLGTWARQINDGSQTTAGFQSYAAQQAKLAFPTLAKQIDSGLTVKQIGDPYAQIAGQTLGIDPNTVDWSQPKWQKALQAQDAQGNITGPMDHLSWEKTIRTDPTYGYSRSEQGQTDAYSLVNALKQGMGAV